MVHQRAKVEDREERKRQRDRDRETHVLKAEIDEIRRKIVEMGEEEERREFFIGG